MQVVGLVGSSCP